MLRKYCSIRHWKYVLPYDMYSGHYDLFLSNKNLRHKLFNNPSCGLLVLPYNYVCVSFSASIHPIPPCIIRRIRLLRFHGRPQAVATLAILKGCGDENNATAGRRLSPAPEQFPPCRPSKLFKHPPRYKNFINKMN
jgi:hypothetical protein